MSNPLLNPNDPRFRKPIIGGSGEANPFSDAEQPAAGRDEKPTETLYSATTNDPLPYSPQYAVQQHPRYVLLFFLGGLGWGAAVVGAVSMTGLFDVGWIAPLLGVGPAAAGWLLSYEDLKAIRLGAIDAAAKQPTMHTFWLGLIALIACLGVVAGMIAQQMHALPDM